MEYGLWETQHKVFLRSAELNTKIIIKSAVRLGLFIAWSLQCIVGTDILLFDSPHDAEPPEIVHDLGVLDPGGCLKEDRGRPIALGRGKDNPSGMDRERNAVGSHHA